MMNTYPTLMQWLDYVDVTDVKRNSLFPPPTWNAFDRNSDTRTNNHLEGELFVIFLTLLISVTGV